jgi:outer membrane lipoprotein-sorting protein
MRRLVCLAVALAVVAAGAARAEEKSDSKAVIEKAIKAVGGEEKLAKVKAHTFKGKGKFYGGGGDGTDYTGEWSVQKPDKMRVEVKAGDFTFVQVVNGDKVWRKLGDNTQEVDDKDQIKEAKENMYAEGVASLLPLVKEKGFEFSALGEVKVGGKPAVGVLVKSKGHRDVNLFFDKDSGLLVKSETVVKDEMAGGKEQTQETLYSDYKEFGGVKHPTKILIKRDGEKYVDAEMSDYEAKEKIDDKVFDKP